MEVVEVKKESQESMPKLITLKHGFNPVSVIYLFGN